ncbi:15882_t:CDS:1 [Funneliformis mosseae]|uniref:15882_t:CDS:1 n=1 Tax=Funneliformis mosseae TaxID=27381 RepID=A0A9N8ZXC3_FUNMO|nr:15882_t:CDS:1 [Funneliformis mosseae]
MRNFTLKNLLVVLTIFVIFVSNGSSVNTGVIEATFKKNDQDKELVARQQTTLKCIGYFNGDKINKAHIDFNIGGIMIPENAIYATLTAECNSKVVTLKPDSAKSKLVKYINKQFVPMKTLYGVQSLGNIAASPKNFGWSVIGNYLLQADPSECLNANEELIGMAQMCVTFNAPAGYKTISEIPCAKITSIVEDCPQNNSPDAILIEKLNKLLNRLAEYFAYSMSRFEKVKKPEDEKAKNLGDCFKKMALNIKVTVKENDIFCVTCDEMDTLSNINKESELQEDRIEVVRNLLKKSKDVFECKFEICIDKNTCVENKESVSNDGISRFSRSAITIMGIPLCIMLNQ